MKINLNEIITMPKTKLRERLDAISAKHGKYSWYLAGDAPIAIVAHIDTVWDRQRLSPRLLAGHGLIWSPDGLGADDRAGVYSALSLYYDMPHNQPRPQIILCDLEETGLIGAYEASELYRQELSDCRYLIGLDRRNGRDCVFYNGEGKKYRRYIRKYGYETAQGTLSDITVIGEAVQRCAVNLSIGVYGEHTSGEYLDISAMERTIRLVRNMIADSFSSRVWILPDRPKWDMQGYGHLFGEDRCWPRGQGNIGQSELEYGDSDNGAIRRQYDDYFGVDFEVPKDLQEFHRITKRGNK